MRAVQDGVKPIDIEATTAAQFALADADGDGRITFPDFLAYYGTLATSQARQELRRAFGPQAESEGPTVVSLAVRHATLSACC